MRIKPTTFLALFLSVYCQFSFASNYYWVGGGGAWSDLSHWANTSNGSGNEYATAPTLLDDVYFDAHSFSASNQTVTIDVDATVRDFDFSAVTHNPIVYGDSTKQLKIAGSLLFSPAITNLFDGETNFLGRGVHTIDCAGLFFRNTITFNGNGGEWTLLSDLTVWHDRLGNIVIKKGTLRADVYTVSLSGDWEVKANGSFFAGIGTVEFNGAESTGWYQECKVSGFGEFYNLTVNRTNGQNARNSVRLKSPITVLNNFTLKKGRLKDHGNQITGNGTGLLKLNSGTHLFVGKTGVSTAFPTGYTTVNITLHNSSSVYYDSSLDQIVSSVPVSYGNLNLSNSNMPMHNKVADGIIQVTKTLNVRGNNNFVDNGFQISGLPTKRIRMYSGSKLTLGTIVSATEFPLGFTKFDLRNTANGSEVIYNAGLPQVVKGLTSGVSYSHLTFSNS